MSRRRLGTPAEFGEIEETIAPTILKKAPTG
jgi:hypothetical protein